MAGSARAHSRPLKEQPQARAVQPGEGGPSARPAMHRPRGRQAAPTDSGPGPTVSQGLGSGTGQHVVKTAVRWPRTDGCTGPERLQENPGALWLDLQADGCPGSRDEDPSARTASAIVVSASATGRRTAQLPRNSLSVGSRSARQPCMVGTKNCHPGPQRCPAVRATGKALTAHTALVTHSEPASEPSPWGIHL